MTLRSRLAAAPSAAVVPVGKGYGAGIPPAIQAAEARSQMTPASPFSPGEPTGPYEGFSRTPRAHDYAAGYNIATRPRTHERVSFETLRGLINSYDVAQICIRHRIASLRSLDWKLVASDEYEGDISAEVAEGKRVLKRPDSKTLFKSWLAKYLRDVFSYDAGTLYRMRNRGGRAVGLKVVSGVEIAPLLDYWGDPPDAPAPAYVQYQQGLPWNWLTRDDLVYEPYDPQPDSIYGRAPLEDVLLTANTDIRFQLYFLQRFCYDDQTEILTRDGWKRLPDVRGDEEFATRSPGGLFEWQASKDGKLHVFDSGGTMVRFKNRDVDLLVTPNHRMLTRRKRQGEGVFKTKRDREYGWHVRRADEFLGRCCVDWRLPLTSTWCALAVPERFTRSVPTSSPAGRSATTKIDMPMWAFARLLGIYIAEGNLRYDVSGKTQRYEVSVSQMAGGKLDEVRRILKDTGLNWSYYSTERTGRFTVGCKALWTYLEQCGHGAENKVLPAEVMDWPGELLEYLIDGLMIGDGTVNDRGQSTYITTSRRLADQVQEIWQKLGIYSSVAVRPPHPTSFSVLEQYHVRARRETEFQMPTPEAVPYDGNVYCVSVPNGIVLVRRNGKTMWCGNTDGNLPAGFASSPDSWTPDQIEQFQGYWDSFMLGDQSRKHQIRWIPSGSKLAWTNEKDFSDSFSLFLMRKTCSSFSVVPSDIGFTEDVNRSSGESQADVQHRVGDLPMALHIQDILTAFLQDDLQLPLKFAFDLGEEQDDRVDQATADDKYMKMGVVGPSEIREMRYGLSDPEPIPRFIYTERAGPIPISSLLAVAGDVDPSTELPVPGTELPEEVFGGTEGVLPNPPIKVMSLAEREFGPSAMPPAPPPQPVLQAPDPLPGETVAKEGEGGSGPAVTAGITSDTGIHGYDLIGAGDDEDGLLNLTPAAHELAKAQRLEVAKAAGEVAVAGLAVLAQDTGRVLMIQRALDDSDPAAGKVEFPGGHCEPGETAQQAAMREWQEETGLMFPAGEFSDSWTSADGIYQGLVYVIPREADIVLIDRVNDRAGR